MEQRIEYGKVSPGALGAMFGLERYVRESGLEPSLVHLVKMRASLINGCAYCVDMHSKDARAAGESEQRLYALAVWRETPFYTARERAALEWTEAITLIHQNDVPDELYARVREELSESELVDLSMAIVAINGWTRLAVAFRAPVGSYQPAAARPVATQPAAPESAVPV
jgi:AhpD family alkylhydroperoxidase